MSSRLVWELRYVLYFRTSGYRIGSKKKKNLSVTLDERLPVGERVKKEKKGIKDYLYSQNYCEEKKKDKSRQHEKAKGLAAFLGVLASATIKTFEFRKK